MLAQLLPASICPSKRCHCWDCIATISGMKALNAHSHKILNFGKLWQNSPARFNQTWIESVLSKWNLEISSLVKKIRTTILIVWSIPDFHELYFDSYYSMMSSNEYLTCTHPDDLINWWYLYCTGTGSWIIPNHTSTSNPEQRDCPPSRLNFQFSEDHQSIEQASCNWFDTLAKC